MRAPLLVLVFAVSFAVGAKLASAEPAPRFDRCFQRACAVKTLAVTTGPITVAGVPLTAGDTGEEYFGGYAPNSVAAPTGIITSFVKNAATQADVGFFVTTLGTSTLAGDQAIIELYDETTSQTILSQSFACRTPVGVANDSSWTAATHNAAAGDLVTLRFSASSTCTALPKGNAYAKVRP